MVDTVESMTISPASTIIVSSDSGEPLTGILPEERLRRLVLAIRAATGIEALVWLVDVAGLPATTPSA